MSAPIIPDKQGFITNYIISDGFQASYHFLSVQGTSVKSNSTLKLKDPRLHIQVQQTEQFVPYVTNITKTSHSEKNVEDIN